MVVLVSHSDQLGIIKVRVGESGIVRNNVRNFERTMGLFTSKDRWKLRARGFRGPPNCATHWQNASPASLFWFSPLSVVVSGHSPCLSDVLVDVRMLVNTVGHDVRTGHMPVRAFLAADCTCSPHGQACSC